MILKEFKQYLQQNQYIQLEEVPKHFHITEVGMVTKGFVDCGGTSHRDSYIYLQIWVADDKKHRLESKKLLDILENRYKMNQGVDFNNMKVLFECDQDIPTIGTYRAEVFENGITLVPIKTDCLAKEVCLPNQCGPGCC